MSFAKDKNVPLHLNKSQETLAGKRSVISEKEYQNFILRYLESNNGYMVRSSQHYDRLHAIDRELLFTFLNETQPEAMDRLQRIYKSDLEEVIVGLINTEATKKGGGLLDVLKHGIEGFWGNTSVYVHKTSYELQSAAYRKISKKHFFRYGRGLGQ